MTTGFALVLLLAAEPKLTPSPEVEARLAAIDASRPHVEAAYERARVLRGFALGSVTLAVVCAVWAVIEVVLVANNAKAAPLSGVPYHAPVPPAVMFGATAVFAVGALVLQVMSRVTETNAAEDEEDLDTQERVLRRVRGEELAP